MELIKMVDLYMDDRKLAWAPSTLKSERLRLNAIIPHLTDFSPDKLWEHLKDNKPYGRVTAWTRVTNFVQYLIDNSYMRGPNQFKIWREKNARQFQNTYQTQKPEISFEEAYDKIQTIQNQEIREHATFILTNGVRFAESVSNITNETVVGKGNRPRRIFNHNNGTRQFRTNYRTFVRALAGIGLKPHDLRKIFLNKLVQKGINTFDLCAVAGWSNLNTAQSYIKANTDNIKKMVMELNNETKQLSKSV